MRSRRNTIGGSQTTTVPPKDNMGSPESSVRRGTVFLLMAVLFLGGSASLAKFLFTTNLDTLIVVQSRSSLSFLLLAFYFLLYDRSVFRIERKDLGELRSGGDRTTIRLKGWTMVSSFASSFGYEFMLPLSKRLLRKYSAWTMLIYAFVFSMLFWFINTPAMRMRHAG